MSLYRIRSLGSLLSVVARTPEEIKFPKGPIWQDDTKGSDSPSVSGQVLIDYLFGGPTCDEVINVYLHIIDKLDCMGVHKFSQPGIFLRTEVAMHVLNKMQGYGKNNLVTADFVKDVAFGSASIRHFLDKINTQTCNTCRYVLIPLHSNWHWHLLSIDLKERRFESWNSLWSHSGAQDAAQLLAKWFTSYFEHILQIPVGASDVIFHKECQQQGSIEVDCGMYTWLLLKNRNEITRLHLSCYFLYGKISLPEGEAAAIRNALATRPDSEREG
ncbi:uncharacterized protein LOC109711664 [Ananas comosus]|uniref:Uncharacterized protein LOC109711664 n=1 Tax=Ananas comosus TaxID=4615 RepID=A0A6P5F434_ANACO|nr:uncharacterized protein LOC109711664 [Ananas comosus]